MDYVGPTVCGHVLDAHQYIPSMGQIDGEGTSVQSWSTILLGDRHHRKQIPVSWRTLGSKPPRQLDVARSVARHDETQLQRIVQMWEHLD